MRNDSPRYVRKGQCICSMIWGRKGKLPICHLEKHHPSKPKHTPLAWAGLTSTLARPSGINVPPRREAVCGDGLISVLF